MYVGLKQPRGDGEHYVTPARAAAKETSFITNLYDIFMCTVHMQCLRNVFSVFFLLINDSLFRYNSPLSHSSHLGLTSYTFDINARPRV